MATSWPQQTTNWRPEHETFGMKTCSIIIAACLAAGGAALAQTSSPGQDQVLTRISNETGVSVHTLRKQEAETGLGFGNLEKANLLAKASGHSFREVVSRFKGGEGWGEIAHDAGLNLGKIVSEAHRSDNCRDADMAVTRRPVMTGIAMTGVTVRRSAMSGIAMSEADGEEVRDEQGPR